MELGPQAGAGSGVDVLFTPIFVLATILNMLPAVLLSLTGGPTLPGGVPLEVAIYGLLHVLFLGRIYQSRRFAASQRERDLDLFKSHQ